MHIRRLMTLSALAVGLVLLGVASSVSADDVDGDGVNDGIDACDNTPAGATVDAEGRPLGDIDRDCDTDLDDCALFQQGFTGPQTPVFLATVTVGNPGNADDTYGDGYGGVDYIYNIGKYEVTAAEYAHFLNAVAGVDTYGLYNTSMWSMQYGCKIERFDGSGTEGDPYQYRVTDEWDDRPVNFVSWGDAARFANWLHNGRPKGGQGLATTEDGSYFLDGVMSETELLAITREPDATWVIPSEDEWYKAAYHYNDGVTGNYYNYATSGQVSSNDLIHPDPGNHATYYDSGHTIGGPYFRTVVGAHENSVSPYGTFDQDGNVWEWNEPVVYDVARLLRGGSWSYQRSYLGATSRWGNFGTSESHYAGFRVAEVP